jgi:outer membrane protein
MKNISLILNVVLLFAVALLFYFHFSQKQTETPAAPIIKTVSSSGIYFVNTDSLWKQYEFVKKSEQELLTEKTNLENQFKAKYQALEKEAQGLQELIGKGILNEENAQKKQAEFMQKEQKLMEYKEQLATKLMEKENSMNEKIQKEIYDYLQLKAKESKIQYILGYTKGGSMLYGNDSLEITKEVLDGLNKNYTKKTEK